MQGSKEKEKIAIKPIAPSVELKAKAAKELIGDSKKYRLTASQEKNVHKTALRFLELVLK